MTLAVTALPLNGALQQALRTLRDVQHALMFHHAYRSPSEALEVGRGAAALERFAVEYNRNLAES